MPSFSSKLDLSRSAKSSNIVLADVDLIKGAFKVYTSSDLSSTNVNYFSDGQIVYVSDSGSLYKATVTLADPGQGIFEDSVAFSQFSFNSGSFTSASFDSGTSELTFFGANLAGSAQISSSVDLSGLGGGGGAGDITAVIAGDGLSGGASTGDATLTLDSGSTHFISAVLGSGLFRLTGSVYATTNDVAITGSLDVNFVESDQEFRVYSQSSIQFSINNEGVAVLAPRDGEPTAVSGGMYFSTDGNFYFGIQQ